MGLVAAQVDHDMYINSTCAQNIVDTVLGFSLVLAGGDGKELPGVSLYLIKCTKPPFPWDIMESLPTYQFRQDICMVCCY